MPVRTILNPLAATAIALAMATMAVGQEEPHDHPMPERLGAVQFATSCAPAVGAAFDRAVALLHSFTYDAADKGFADVAARDPGCAMAHWGRAMTHYHQLWDTPAGAGLRPAWPRSARPRAWAPQRRVSGR